MDSARLAKERDLRFRADADPEQAKAEKDRKIQELPPELRPILTVQR